jgi:tyrosine-protein kinase Etk/Wzc
VVAKDGTILGQGAPGRLFQSEDLRLLVGEADCRAEDEVLLSPLPFDRVVEGLRGGIKASEVGNKTGIIRVAARAGSPVRARDLVNTLVQVYLERSVTDKAEEASRTVDFVEGQLSSVRSELDTAEKGLQAFKTSAGLIQLDAEAVETIRKLSDGERQKTDLSLQRKQAEYALASLKESRKRGQVYSPAVMRDDPLVSTLAGRLSELEIQKQALLVQNTEDHPAVKTVQGQIDEIQRKLQATYDTTLANLARQETAVDNLLAGYDATLRGLPASERELARLTRLAKVNADIYTFLLNKHEESRIARAATISNIRIVDPAITPLKPVKPQKRKNLMLGLILGAMLGVGLAFFREYMDDSLKDPEQAKGVMGLPLLAVIPCLKQGDAASGDDLVVVTEPRSVGAESFRTLRTALHFSSVGQEHKVLLVTSSFPGEGKSTISANLGVALSQTGARVLIIDCDLRRPSLHDRFGHSKAPGLTEIITGDAAVEKVIHNTGIDGLDFISAGTIPPNPAELVGSAAMASLLAALRPRYDHVILDAPPVLAVTDTPLLSAAADLMLIVLEAGRVPAKAAARTREVLATTGRPVIGIVFNDKQNRGEGYGSYGYSYYSAYGYTDKDEKTRGFKGELRRFLKRWR